MVSSLAAQLSKGVSLNATFLTDRSRRKRVESYLFAGREVDQQDFHSIHALGVTGLLKLKTLDPKFAEYEENIFSDSSRDLDRTLQSISENAQLDRTLGACLRDLGPYLLESPTAKVLEWLVRRFRVNEFNINDVMALFLPYHDTPHFAKIVSILHVGQSRLWSFLAPIKAAGKHLPRSILVDEMSKNVDLSRFVTALLPNALEVGRTYRTLVGFTASVMVDYLAQMKRVNEETMAFILPAIVRTFAVDSDPDCALAGYLTLATLSRRCNLSSEGLVALMAEMIKGRKHVKSQQMLPLLIAVVGPQDELHQFPDSLTDSILKIPEIIEAIPGCLKWIWSDKMVAPLLPGLVNRADEKPCFNLMESILASPHASSIIIERQSSLCMEKIMKTGASTPLIHLLSIARQRDSAAFSNANEKLSSGAGNVSALKSALRGIALPSSFTADDREKWILLSQDTDHNSRVVSIRELLKTLEAGDGREDLCEALRSRVMDTNLTVVETLYSKPQLIIPILGNQSFVESVATALATANVSRAIMRTHFNFVACHLYDCNPSLNSMIFERIFLPYLLFTKPRQKTASIFWQTLRGSKLASYELLADCIDVVFPQSAEDEKSFSVEEMSELNLAVTAKIAGNIIASNSYHGHLDMILRLIKSSDAHTSIVAYLLSRSLLDQLSGEHQVDAGHRILIATGLSSLDVFHSIRNIADLQEAISSHAMSKSVVSKPSSEGTIRRLQAVILAILPVIPRPVGVTLDWLGDAYPESADSRGRHFVKLARAVYVLANSSSLVQKLSTFILKALFVNLQEDALLLLAGIWSTGVQSDGEPNNLRHIALSHGAAFLKAQATALEHPQDFQVILPSLMVAMQSKQRSVRQAALECISIFEQYGATMTASPTIFALNSAYGIKTGGLQYLEQSDFRRYVSSLHSHREHFINDSDYLDIFHQAVLCKKGGDNKRDAAHKYRILCYISSHVVVWTSLKARTALLKTMKNVSDNAKLQELLPLIEQLVPRNVTNHPEDSNPEWNEYCRTLLATFDETASEDLNETGSRSWSAFMRVLSSMLTSDVSSTIRDTIFQLLRTGIFNKLIVERQAEICITLIDAAAAQTEYYSQIKETLKYLLNNPTLTAKLLTHFQPKGADSPQRPKKRVKAIHPPASASEPALRSLTILVEVLNMVALPASTELMSCIIDVLTQVFHTRSSNSDANYLMQIIMSTLLTQASALPENTNLSSNSVRMEVLVELLRASDNPQTFNQTLLLIASLARLSPEFVVQNVMPVFTFMGSNVFHRDDTYSFRVVQKTVESIVPVMVDSFRKTHTSSPALHIASREFLRIFTDASMHIPRHRRTRFFNHLVGVLGPEEFTVPIFLLLVDKLANKVIRQKPGDVEATLSLPLAVLQENFRATPFGIVERLLQEVSRMGNRISTPESATDDVFLESPMDGEHTSSTIQRQMQAILLFVDLVLQRSSRRNVTSDEGAIRNSVHMLLELLHLGHSSPSAEFLDISRIAMKALGRLLRVISAVEFVSSICTILDTNNPAVESGAMNLLSSRLVNITPRVREEVSSMIIRITKYASETLKNSDDLPTLKADIKAVTAVAKTAANSEIQELTQVLPIILQVPIRQHTLTADVLACILHLTSAMGPRILPSFRSVVMFCCDAITQTVAPPEGQHDATDESAQSVLVALLNSLSQFWGIDELARLSALSLDPRPVSLTLRKTLAKKVPARQLLPALFRTWDDLTATAPAERLSRQEAFFTLLRQALKGAPREDVHQHLRQTFKLFLYAFDTMHGEKDAEHSERALTAAFVEVATKLNEAAFKPLFRRLFDWAFDESEKSQYRRVAFCHLLTALIKLLKGLLTPYMATVLVPLASSLDSYRDHEGTSRFWFSAIELLETSIKLDEGAFWQTDKFKKLMPTIIAQIDLCPFISDGSARLTLKTCLSSLAAAIDDDSLVKSLNMDILIKTRSDDAQIRLFALECARHLWHDNGDKLIGLVSDVVPFIAECADDEHDEVAKEARKLRKAIESKCGSLDMLLQ